MPEIVVMPVANNVVTRRKIVQTFMAFVAVAVKHDHMIESAKLARSAPSVKVLAFLDEMMPRGASLKTRYPC